MKEKTLLVAIRQENDVCFVAIFMFQFLKYHSDCEQNLKKKFFSEPATITKIPSE